MKIKVGKRYLNNGNGILKCIAQCNGVFVVKNNNGCYHVNSKCAPIFLNELGDYEEYDDRPDLGLVCEFVSAEEDSSPDVAEVFNKMIEMKVGNFYFSKKAGVLECIAERKGIFIVENDEYCYHVNQSGVALYIDDNDNWYSQKDNEFDLQCKAGFDVAKVLHNFLKTEDGKEFMKNLKPEVKPKETKHEHYFKDVSHLEKIDVYTILSLYEVTDPCIQHAVKKLLCTGKRGHKDFLKDVQDSIDSLVRCIELNEELSK